MKDQQGLSPTSADRHWQSGIQPAMDIAAGIARSSQFEEFSHIVRGRFPWRFEQIRSDVLARDYLRVVDHHLRTLIPPVQAYMGPGIRRVLDFGCGSGGSAIALALAYPGVRCCGTDVDSDEIEIARERARLYGVADRCEFEHVAANRPLPFSDGSFDLCLCSSVLEYVIDKSARRFCVQEMVRLLAPGGLMVVSAPNRLYPFEVHSWWRGKPNWGWNYFPRWLRADTVDCTMWEVRRLARPATLKLYRTPLNRLFKPWSIFCLRRQS